MSIIINGTTGISGVDGTAGTPSLQGNDTNTGIVFGTDTVGVSTGGVQRTTVDSSGRLLVGTSTTSTTATTVFQGNSASSTGAGVVHISRGSTANASGDGCGVIRFSDNSQNTRAEIEGSSDGTGGANDYPGKLTFSVTRDGASSPTESLRIANKGETAIGSTGNVLFVGTTQASGTGNYLIIGRSSITDGSPFTSGSDRFYVYANGNVQNTNNSYGAISDIKLKENIVDASSQWSDIKTLQVRKYNFKEGQTHTQIGLVAQEVELVSPGLVDESPDRDADGTDLGTTTKSVNYSVLYMKAVKALQEAMERIEVLEQRLTDAGIA
jgi:hypothetical protein